MLFLLPRRNSSQDWISFSPSKATVTSLSLTSIPVLWLLSVYTIGVSLMCVVRYWSTCSSVTCRIPFSSKWIEPYVHQIAYHKRWEVFQNIIATDNPSKLIASRFFLVAFKASLLPYKSRFPVSMHIISFRPESTKDIELLQYTFNGLIQSIGQSPHSITAWTTKFKISIISNGR